jgi:hypothetical protein
VKVPINGVEKFRPAGAAPPPILSIGRFATRHERIHATRQCGPLAVHGFAIEGYENLAFNACEVGSCLLMKVPINGMGKFRPAGASRRPIYKSAE